MKLEIYNKSESLDKKHFIELVQCHDRVDVRVVTANGQILCVLLGIHNNGTVSMYRRVPRGLGFRLDVEGRVSVNGA